jgi:hypothetical protein
MAVSSGLSISSHGSRSAWTLSWPMALGLVMFVCLMNANGLPLLGDPDSHWHIAVGNWILEHRAVPYVDTYSFTFTGEPWIAKEWLSQVLLAGAYDIAGWGGVVALGAAAFAATFALLLRLLLRDIKPLPAILFVAVAIAMTAPHILARPHALAMPFMLLWVAGLVRAVEERRAPEPLLLGCMLLWANLHGGFTLGLMMAGAFALEAVFTASDGSERKALFVGWLKFGIVAGLVACITPYGPESIVVTLRIFNLGDSLKLIAEWKSPDFQSQPMQELVLLVALYLALSRGLRLPLFRLLVVIGLVHLFLRYARNAELLAMLAPLAIAPVLARQWPSIRPDPEAPHRELGGMLARLARPAGHGALALGLLLAAVFSIGMIRLAGIAPPDANTPSAALAYAREAGIKGHVFNHYGFGGFLIGAGVPTFIDGRGELYGGDFIKRYAEAVNLRGEEPFEKVLERWHIDWTLLAMDAPANKLLARLPGWHQAYSDEQATIFVRDR